MKKLFWMGCFALGFSDVYAQFSYKDLVTMSNKAIEADQAMCVTPQGEIVKAFQDYATNSLTFRTYIAPDFSKYNWKSYNATGEAHELIYLKNGGFAVAARNHFGILDKDFVVTKSIGSKMTDWRAPQLSPSGIEMARWKQGGIGVSVTSVDFLEVAESPNGNYVCGLFIWHQWEGDVAKIRLGMAVSDLTQGGKMTLHDLNLTLGSDPDNPIDASQYVELSCLDDSKVLIGYANDNAERFGHEFMVVDFTKIVKGEPLNAEIWHGKLHTLNGLYAAVDAMLVHNGEVYYAIGDQDTRIIGKAKWDGSKLAVIKSVEYPNIFRVHTLSDLDKDYMVLSGLANTSVESLNRQPSFIKLKKSDLSLGKEEIISSAGVQNDLRYSGAILDVYTLDPVNQKIAVLVRGKYNDKQNPGPFYLTTVQLSK